MKAIRDYVEVMFQEFPKTKKIGEIKLNIIDAMESKYDALISEGKNEQESLGIVIGQFGNINELKEEFDLEVDENAEYLESDEVKNYLYFKKKFGNMIALGVVLILFGVGLVVLFSDTAYENIVTYIMLMLVTVAVLIFVMMGLESEKYKEIDEARYHLEGNDLVKYQKEFELFRPKFNLSIAIGVVLCIFGGTSPILIEGILGLHENLFAIILFPSIAIAVSLFTTMGVKYNAYQTLVEPNKVRVRKAEGEEGEYGWIFGVTMPLAAMFYLYIGLYLNAWHPGWIVFPITAIATTSIMLILEHRKKN